jgi:pilus assembly protein Flp/PilA
VSRVYRLLNDVRKDEEGATMVEYAILVTLISVVAIAVITTLGKVVNNSFNTACASMNNGTC